ncbi:unnamed protein product [Schistosoma curassoni]|uniref:PA domain-containing protein n=1 Tax=Schistosoma curassoni TaxID=6186 RepID=A0A183KX04_9TREM|nr:unnamed protein product [Schistosoma curassoni]
MKQVSLVFIGLHCLTSVYDKKVPQGRNIVSDDMNSLNSSNCQSFVENSTCVINSGNNITAVKKSSIICHFPVTSMPTASTTTTLPTTSDIPSYSIEDKDRNFPKGRSLNNDPIVIPGHPTHCMRVLHSKNFFTHKGPIIILLQGGGIAQAGVWAPRLLLHPQHGLQSGSQISLVKKAHEQGYAIAIINANEHVPSEAEMDAMEKFPNPSCPLFNVTECVRIDHNLKSPVHGNNHDVPIYLTLPDHSNKLILPALDSKSHHPVAFDSSLENPILFVPCKSSTEQESKQLFRSCLTRTPSSSSALSCLLTGSNSTSSSTMRTNSNLQKTPVCCVNSICSTNETCLTSSTTDLTLNTHVKSVGSTVNAPSSSSMLNATHSLNYESQSQKHVFLVPSNSIALKNLIQVSILIII